MFRKEIFCLVFLFFGTSVSIYGQLVINFPQQRAVFQRDNANNGKINIHGYVPNNTTKVEARLLPIRNDQGVQTDWQVVDAKPTGGTFCGQVSGKGGWYVLQVRSFEKDVPNGQAQLDRVGIGEVFIIAGQSNGEGFSDPIFFGVKGAADDRVNAYTHNKRDFINEQPPIGEFGQLSRDVNIGPRGSRAWAWGELGDQLVRQLNVPVLFFNSSYLATNIENWRKSSVGETTILPFFTTPLTNQNPYSYLRIILQNHVSVYGLRSILWIHGESDNFLKTPAEKYFQDLKFLIEKTRSDTGRTINWVVSRTSVFEYNFYEPVINAQNRVISEVPAVFAGPQTDLIQIPRYDGTHFHNAPLGIQGLTNLATAFKQSLDSSFFQKSIPVIANPILQPKVSCNSENLVELSIEEPFSSIVWNKTITSPKIVQSSGTYQAITRDSFGNYKYSAQVDISKAYPLRPNISAIDKSIACIGEELNYKTDRDDLEVIWQNGSVSKTYKSTSSEDIFARFKNSLGCSSSNSNALKSVFESKPQKPVITSKGGQIGACEGSSIELNVTTGESNIVKWSNDKVGKSITISQVGKTSVFARVSTPSGSCFSDDSSPFEVEIVNQPESPTIIKSGPYSIAVEKLQNQIEYEWYEENTLLQRTSESQFQVPKDGFYKVRVTTEYPNLRITCPSNFSGLYNFFKESTTDGIKIYPIPIQKDEFFIASDKLINTARLTLIDNLGRVKMVTTINNLLLPQAIKVNNNRIVGTYHLKVEYDGFYKVFPIIFE